MSNIKTVFDAFNIVSKAHKDIQETYMGTSFDVAVKTDTVYPISFIEIPLNLVYANDRKFKTFNFAYYILIKGEQDDVVKDINTISIAEEIGDMVISKIQNDYSDKFYLTNINGVSLNSYSDDMLCGVRFEITVNLTRNYSLPKCYIDKFNNIC
jgi:hypothetical protein